MAEMNARKRMERALKARVVPGLRQAGFTGSFPHLRRAVAGKVDLLSFLASSQYGGGFLIGASVVFPNAENPEDTNWFYPSHPPAVKKATWGDGRIRSGLPTVRGVSHDEDAFYYVDLYREVCDGFTIYAPFTPEWLKHVDPEALGYELVRKADDGVYDRVAQEVNRQLPALMEWFDAMTDIEALRAYDKAAAEALEAQQNDGVEACPPAGAAARTNGTGIEYRRVGLNQLDELVRTRIEVLRAANRLDDGVDLSEVERESRLYYKRALADGSHVAYLAYDGERFVGAGGVSFYRVMPTVHNVTGKKAYIMNMYVRPEYRRRGIATAILRRLVDAAQVWGAEQIALEATDAGRPLYEHYGFVPMAHEMELP